MKAPSEAPVTLVLEFQKLENEGKQLEAALLLAEGMVAFEEDKEILRKLSAVDFVEFVQDWMKANE